MPLIATLALTGLIAGHILRRALPRLIGLRERSLPFSTPWMEIVAAALLSTAAWRLGLQPALYAAAALVLLLLAASASDYLVQLIPDALTFGGAAAGLLLALLPHTLLAQPLHGVLLEAWGVGDPRLGSLALAAAGGALGFCLLEIVRRVFGWVAGLDVMGMGDSKLAMLIGAFLGPVGVVLAAGASFALGVLHGGVFWLRTGKSHAPFGPALAAGALVVALGRDLLLRAFWTLQEAFLALGIVQLAILYALLLGVVVWMLVRLRRNAAAYEASIEEDYREVDLRLEGGEDSRESDRGVSE